MLVHRAEEAFHKGITMLESGRPRDAVAFFKAAIDIENQVGGGDPGQARYVSYYGLGLCLSRTASHEAIACCRKAAEFEGYRPEVWWNLGRVALTAGRRGEAHRAFHRGLALQPGHPGILRDLQRMGIRRRPALPFLPRKNPLNVFFGHLRRTA